MTKDSAGAYWRRDFPVVQGFKLYGREWPDFPVQGFCFAYESAALPTLMKCLAELDGNEPLERRVDMVCSMGKGCISNGTAGLADTGEVVFTDWRGVPDANTQRFPIPLDPDEQPGVSLMLFYLLACSGIVQATTHPLRLVPYMERR